MPDIQPIPSEDTGLSVWVPIAVVVGVLALLSVPALYLIRELTEVAIGAPQPGASSGPETTGSVILTQDTTMTADHLGNIVIGADNITLDCRGFSVIGTGRNSLIDGVSLLDRTGVTVKNCVVTSFNAGFIVNRSEGNQFFNNTITEVNSGFTLLGSSANTIARNEVINAYDWFGYGTFEASGSNLFEHNHATGVRGVAFMADSGEENRFVANEANANSGVPFSDHTTGSGDAGTANRYKDNVCAANSERASPAGLCS